MENSQISVAVRPILIHTTASVCVNSNFIQHADGHSFLTIRPFCAYVDAKSRLLRGYGL